MMRPYLLTINLTMNRADEDRLVNALRRATAEAQQGGADVSTWLPWRTLEDQVRNAFARARGDYLGQLAEGRLRRRHDQARRRLPLTSIPPTALAAD